jgi:two-component system response regulator RegA
VKKSLLIIEDDESLGQALSEDFIDLGLEVTVISSLKNWNQKSYDFVILDLRLNGEYGLNIISNLKQVNPNCSIVVLTGYGSTASAVEAIKLGASNYLLKPASIKTISAALFENTNDVVEVVENSKRKTLTELEHEYIEFVLAQNKGNISKTATELGLHRQSLQRKLKKFP